MEIDKEPDRDIQAQGQAISLSTTLGIDATVRKSVRYPICRCFATAISFPSLASQAARLGSISILPTLENSPRYDLG